MDYFTSFNQELIIKFIEHLNWNNKIYWRKYYYISCDLLDDNIKINDDACVFSICSPIVCYKTENKKTIYFDPSTLTQIY